MSEDRIPPYSEEAEKAALGALLADCLRVLPIAKRMMIAPDSYYVPAHRIIQEAIEGVEEEGRIPDTLTVAEWLKRAGKLDAVGGTLAIDRMIDSCPAVTHAEYYLDIVRQKQILRSVVTTCRKTEAECFEAERGDTTAMQCADNMMQIMEHNQPAEETPHAIMLTSKQRWRDAKDKKVPAIGLALPGKKLTELTCGLEPGMFIVAGRPSMGKTTLEGQISTNLAAQGIPVARITLDHTKEELYERAICMKAGVSLPKLKWGFAGEAQLAQVDEAIEELAEYPMYVNDRDRDISIIRPWARMMVARFGIQLLTIDYMQIIQAYEMGSYQWNDVARVTHVSGQLKALAGELNIPVLALSQLSRAGEGKDGKKRAPKLSDLRESGAIEQDAAKVAFVYRDDKMYEEMEEEKPGSTKHKRATWVDLLKHKNGEIGTTAYWMRPHYFRMDETENHFPYVDVEAEVEQGVFPVGMGEGGAAI